MNADEHRPAGSARRAASRTRAVRWALGMGVGLMCAIGLVLLFLLTQATNNRALYERNFTWLLGVNVLVALVLFTVLVWGAVRLGVRLKRGRFGSRLLVKLAGIFGLVGVVPGLLIYVVSYQFVSRSIESWFDVRVEGALSAGVSLARVTLDTIAGDLASKTRTASSQLAQVPDAAAGLVLERMRDQLGATDLVLWSASGQPLASAGQSRFSLNPERPGIQQFRNARWTTSPTRRPRTTRGCAPWSWCKVQAWACWPSRASCRPRCPCRRRWSPTPSPCRRPTANTRSVRWRAAACDACTSAR
jgi:hypothetical protein